MTTTQDNIDRSEKHRFSLISRGANAQFRVSILLMSVIPTLTLVYLIVSDFPSDGISRIVQLIILAIVVTIACCGYAISSKYPRTITQLHQYLKCIANEQLPNTVHLTKEEDDIAAIEKYLNMIVFATRSRIATIQNHREELIKAERQRVMLESLGTACHHLGQPATAIAVYLEMLKRESLSKEARTKLDSCLKEAETMREIFEKLLQVSEYRTEPYFSSDSERHKEQIIKI